MKTSPSQAAELRHLLARMPDSIASTFSPVQQQALAAALTPRRHPIDIRLSIPVLKYYIVLLAGPEKRSPERLREEAQHRPLWTPMNLLVLGTGVAIGSLTLLGLLQLGQHKLQRFKRVPTAPSEIPFKADRPSCEASGRVWQNGTCLDYTHDPNF